MAVTVVKSRANLCTFTGIHKSAVLTSTTGRARVRSVIDDRDIYIPALQCRVSRPAVLALQRKKKRMKRHCLKTVATFMAPYKQ